MSTFTATITGPLTRHQRERLPSEVHTPRTYPDRHHVEVEAATAEQASSIVADALGVPDGYRVEIRLTQDAVATR